MTSERLVTAARGQLLDLSYEVLVEDRALAPFLTTVLRDSATPDEMVDQEVEPTRFELRGTPSAPLYVVTIDDDEVVSTERPKRALSSLMWHLNRTTVDRSRHRLLFHASVVDLGDRSVAFLGRSGDGKTTSALQVARSLDAAIVTDDIASIDSSGRWTGARKPLGLREGSRTLLGLTDGSLPVPPSPYRGETWYAAASALGVSVSSAAPPTDIVRLATESDDVAVTAERRSTGFAALLESAFDHRRLSIDEVHHLAELVRHCRFWSWRPSTIDSLRPALAAP